MIIQLSDFLRYSIGNDEKQFVKLKEEINNITRYLSIEKVRFGNKIEFTREIDEECLEQELPNMILQPLVENAIKHGVYEATDTVFVRIKAKKSRASTIVSIFNNYDGESINRTGKGVGIQNIKNRLKLMYNRDDLLNINHGENTFEVTLLIPGKEKKGEKVQEQNKYIDKQK
jgi:LytS/YehU family sensor histidine kinase